MISGWIKIQNRRRLATVLMMMVYNVTAIIKQAEKDFLPHNLDNEYVEHRGRQQFCSFPLPLRRNMEFTLRFSKITFHIHTKEKIEIDDTLKKFAYTNNFNADVTVLISWDWKTHAIPTVSMTGNDLVQNYYIEQDTYLCETQGGAKGAIAMCRCTPDFSHIQCVLNLDDYAYIPRQMDFILRTLPMRAIFQQFGTLFFHAAQIAVKETGILFTAPSGTGKTTQAKLWEKYRGARHICADRTLVRRLPEGWRTFGYPLDGSEPICSEEEHTLGAVVLLRQGQQNQVVRLNGRHAIAALMPQMVIDGWSAEAKAREIELLANLLEEIPVYQLNCTPDETAVRCLEQRLIKDGVIES